jgi:hypothetical protein
MYVYFLLYYHRFKAYANHSFKEERMMIQTRLDLLLQLRDYSWDKEGWFPPLHAALEGVGAPEASWVPTGGGNTIWQLVNHINLYNDRLLYRLKEKPFMQLSTNTATFGEPGNPEDTEGWQATLDKTRLISENLRNAMASLSENDLDTTKRSSPLIEELAAWIMHDAYHIGQILLTRKLQHSWPSQQEYDA